MSATAAGFGGADQIVEGQRQWRLAQLKRQLIQLIGGSIELQQQGVEECRVLSDHGLLWHQRRRWFSSGIAPVLLGAAMD